MFSQLAFDDSESKSCSVNRYVYAFEQVRKTADMVLVSMRDEYAANL